MRGLFMSGFIWLITGCGSLSSSSGHKAPPPPPIAQEKLQTVLPQQILGMNRDVDTPTIQPEGMTISMAMASYRDGQRNLMVQIMDNPQGISDIQPGNVGMTGVETETFDAKGHHALLTYQAGPKTGTAMTVLKKRVQVSVVGQASKEDLEQALQSLPLGQIESLIR